MKYLGKIESEKDLVTKSYVDSSNRIVDGSGNVLPKRNFLKFQGNASVADDPSQQYTTITISEESTYVNIEFTLSVNGWNGKEQIYYNEHLTATCPVLLKQITPTSANISVYGQQVGALVFACDKVPEKDVQFTGTILIFDQVDNPESFSNALSKYISKQIITLSAANWVNNVQEIAVGEVYSDSSLLCSPTTDSRTAYESSFVHASGVSLGTVTFSCVTTPTKDLEVEIVILNAVNT